MLVIKYGGEEPRPLDGDEKPLELQDQFLEKIGFTDPSRRARIGIDHDLRFLLAFNTGPKWSGRSGEVWLLKGLVLPQWKKRNIILRAGLMIIQPQEGREWCGGERIRVSRSSPSESPRAGRAVLKVISETDRSLYIGFDHRWQQNLWHSWLTQEVGRCEGDLSGLGLTTIPKDLKETCASPNILDLSSNRLTEEGCTGLESFNQLTRLCLADNRLERVPQIINRSNFPVLVSLDLSHNGIRHLPPSLAYMDRSTLTTLLFIFKL
ncbi:hypothetical protein O3M35_005408 [Rhynocoris fuscipes]|uniref:PHLPP-like RA domain-containing protein n=1 Tax=Rhynocoris fuscipes TaxID=488301 RepID=A0AAW1DJ12_9HEMI